MLVNEARYLEKFKCLGSECPNSCCSINWSIKVDDRTSVLYLESGKLKDVIEKREDDSYYIIQKLTNNSCIKLEKDGLCGVQKEFGADYLSDTCFFYPRNSKRINDEVFVSANLSCPEIAKLVLFDDESLDFAPKTYNRLPKEIQNYAGQIEDKHFLFIEMSQIYKEFSDDFSLFRYLLSQEDAKVADINGSAHIEKILLFFTIGLKISSAISKPLLEFTQVIPLKLGLGLDIENLAIYEVGDKNPETSVEQLFRYHDDGLNKLMKKYVEHSLILGLYPVGKNKTERVEFLAILLAKATLLRFLILVKKSLGQGNEDEIIALVNNLSRTYDHIKDPAIYRSFINDVAWNVPSQLLAIVSYFERLSVKEEEFV